MKTFFIHFQLNCSDDPLELKLLGRVRDVPGVIKLLDFIETKDSFMIVMEKPSNCQDLFDFIGFQPNENLSEEIACDFFYKILKTIIGCYDKKVIHRDIKPENILVDCDSFELKLIDFGGGSVVKEEAYNELKGTRVFYPPEWYTNSEYHAESSTVWSLGILLYSMVRGIVPFHTEEDIRNAEVEFDDTFSSDCENIIRKCLIKNPKERASLLDILEDVEDEWLASSVLSDTSYFLEQKNSNDTSSKVSPKKLNSMASTSKSSNDSGSTHYQFRSLTKESIEDNFFNVKAAKKRRYQDQQILADIKSDSADPIVNVSVSKKAKYELDTDHQTEVEPVIDSIDNYQFGTDDEFEDESSDERDSDVEADYSCN